MLSSVFVDAEYDDDAAADGSESDVVTVYEEIADEATAIVPQDVDWLVLNSKI